MSNQLPAHLQQYQAPDIGAALSQNLGSAMPPHVSIGGGRFTLIDASNNEIPVPTFDPQIGVYLDACIVDVNNVMSRIYFSGAYDSDAEGVRPDCFSDNGTAPSISANSPQAVSCTPDPTRTFGCKWAVWGSKINATGKKVPACAQKQKVALLIPGFANLFLLAVPPNSHGPLREYVELSKGNKINIADVITRISFVPGVQGTLQFRAVTYIDEPTAKLRQAAYAEHKTDSLVGRTDVPRTMALAAPVQPAPTTLSPNLQVYEDARNRLSGQPGGQQATVGDMNRPMVASQQVAQTNWPQQTQQVQQPGPFVPATTAQPSPNATGAANQPGTGWPSSNPAPAQAASTTSPSEPAAAPRRRRRTAAEMQQANGAAGAPQGTQAPAQAPFPHPGQQGVAQPQGGGTFVQSTTPGTLPGQLDFGMAPGTPAGADPAIAGMLDDFFKQQ